MDEVKQISTRYLLGELSEQERSEFEERYFADADVFNEVLQVESQLVDAYAREQLSTEERERFEQSYLTHPALRNRARFSKALTTRIDGRERSVSRTGKTQSTLHLTWTQRLLAAVGGPRPAWRFALALVILLIAIAGIWWWRQQQREASQIQAQREEQQRREQEQPTPQQSTGTPRQEERIAQTPPEVPQPSPGSNTNSTPSVVSLALTVGGVRSAEAGATQTLIIPHGTTQAQILLYLKDDSYPRYRVSLQMIGGREILTQTNIRPRNSKTGARFVFTVRAGLLTKGDYALTLSGVTPQGEVDDLSKSLFRVEKQ